MLPTPLLPLRIGVLEVIVDLPKRLVVWLTLASPDCSRHLDDMPEELLTNVNQPSAASGSWASSEAARRTMIANRSRDTKPEMAVRSAVHRQGLRYRVAVRPLPELRRTADLVFRSTKVAVFVDGCFWHRCPEHYVEPKSNQKFWRTKIAGNVRRDEDTNSRLRAAGWEVLRFWEHEPVDDIVTSIIEAVTSRRAS